MKTTIKFLLVLLVSFSITMFTSCSKEQQQVAEDPNAWVLKLAHDNDFIQLVQEQQVMYNNFVTWGSNLNETQRKNIYDLGVAVQRKEATVETFNAVLTRTNLNLTEINSFYAHADAITTKYPQLKAATQAQIDMLLTEVAKQNVTRATDFMCIVRNVLGMLSGEIDMYGFGRSGDLLLFLIIESRILESFSLQLFDNVCDPNDRPTSIFQCLFGFYSWTGLGWVCDDMPF